MSICAQVPLPEGPPVGQLSPFNDHDEIEQLYARKEEVEQLLQEKEREYEVRARILSTYCTSAFFTIQFHMVSFMSQWFNAVTCAMPAAVDILGG